MKSNLDRCVQLRLAGADYDKIAAQLKLPREEVERLVAEGVAALNSEPSELRSRLELARLDGGSRPDTDDVASVADQVAYLKLSVNET